MNTNEDRAKRETGIVAKLLSAEKSGQTLSFEESVNALYKTIRTDFQPALEQSSVRDKDRNYADLISIVDSMGIFCSFPELLGKSFVGIFGLDADLTAKFMTSSVGTSAAEQAKSDSNVPAIFIDGKAGITAVNDVGNTPELSGLEYSDTNRSLWRRDIDIRNFLKFYFIKGNMKCKNTAFVYFPAHVNIESETCSMLLEKLDAVVVCALENYDSHKNKPLVREVQKKRNIPVKFIVDETDITACTDVYKVRNSLFTDRIRSTLLEIKSFYDREIARLQEDRTRTAADLVNITLESTREAVTQLSNDVRNRLNELEQEKNKLNSASVILMDKAKVFEAEMGKCIPDSQNVLYCESTKEIWQKIFLHAVDSKDISLASEYLGKLQRSGETFVYYIYSMLFMQARGEHLHSTDLEKLRYSPDSELVLKAKLRLRRELNFSDENCAGIAFAIKSLDTPEEFYYRGMWCESRGDRKQAEGYYRRSLSMGYAPAGTKLFNLAGNDRKTLQILADQMIPEANFALGEIARGEGKFKSANRYFKLAAAREYMPAVKILADEALRLFVRDPDRRKAERSIQLYRYILSREPGNTDIREKIGDVYHRLDDDRRALECWEQCRTATAFYKMGDLYMYHYGTFGQDLDTAKAYFQQAYTLGSYKALKELNKIQIWEANEEQKKRAELERKQRESYTPRRESHSYSSSSSSGCFVITAANSSLNVLDRWAFKRLLAWKNKLKKESPMIAGLLEDYDRFAPVIVSKIEQEKNLYWELWDKFISKVYKLVCQKKYYDAARVYADMMKMLCSRYRLKIPEETRRNLDCLSGCEYRETAISYEGTLRGWDSDHMLHLADFSRHY